jgi:hypothetical protein
VTFSRTPLRAEISPISNLSEILGKVSRYPRKIPALTKKIRGKQLAAVFGAELSKDGVCEGGGGCRYRLMKLLFVIKFLNNTSVTEPKILLSAPAPVLVLFYIV